MGKLKEMVVEDDNLANRVKYNGRRIQLAGIGLFAKIIEASGKKDDESVVGKLNALGAGTVNLVREETQRIFDELVEAGEAFTEETPAKPAKTKGGNKVAKKTIKPANPANETAKPETAKTAKKAEGAAKPKKAKRVAKPEEVDPALKKAFTEAQAKAKKVADLPHDKELQLMALVKQAEEGDVKGRRPAKTKVEECEIFDARREIKGMKQDEAMNRFIEAVQAL